MEGTKHTSFASSSSCCNAELDCIITMYICGFVFEWVPSTSPGQWCFAAVIKPLISSKLIAFPSVMNQATVPTCLHAVSITHKHRNRQTAYCSHESIFCSHSVVQPVVKNDVCIGSAGTTQSLNGDKRLIDD